jgi:hypothetical protein
LAILRYILEQVAISNSYSDENAGAMVPAVGSAVGLPGAVGGRLGLDDPSIDILLNRGFCGLAGPLLEWCLYELLAMEPDEVDQDIASKFADRYFVSLIDPIVECRTVDEDELLDEWSIEPHLVDQPVDLTSCQGTLFVGGIELLRELEECVLSDWSHHRSTALMRALYRKRSERFGGVFPFAITDHRVPMYLLQLTGSYWLADFFKVTYFEQSILRYCYLGVDPEGGYSNSRFDRVRAARTRFDAYKSALREIEADRNLELARAWWSFFLASQGQYFGDLGLGAEETGEAIDIATRLGPDRALDKALAMLRQTCKTADTELARRSLIALLPPESSGHVSPLRNLDLVSFLKRKIKPEVWNKLSVATRRDLEDAEALWQHSHREIGAGRSDWGGVAIAYCRAFEGECKTRLLPLVKALQKAGFARSADVSKLSLGQLEHALRASQSKVLPAHADLASSVAAFIDLFDTKAKSLLSVRNRAAHADRQEPIDPFEFFAARTAIFEQGVFEALIAL